MSRSSKWISLAVVMGAVGAMVTGCGDSPTGVPDEPAGSVSFGEVDKATEGRLRAQLESAKDRIRVEKENRRADFKAAKAEWEVFHKQWDRYRKTHKDAKVDLLRCEPQEYDGEAKIIGPAGGELHAGDHKLVIPRGALLVPTIITAEAPTTSLIEVDFEPHGLVFEKRPVLTLSYKHCLQPEGEQHGVAYLSAQGDVLENLRSHDDRWLDQVEAWLEHFSRYAITY